MKIISNSIIPFKGFCAINLFGVMFVRKECSVSSVRINHEEIHTAQMKELGYIFFYLVYLFEWLTNLIITPNTAYKSISFEEEAYAHQSDMEYLEHRKHYAQWRG